MSNQKKFDAISKEVSVIDNFKSINGISKSAFLFKNKDMFQKSDAVPLSLSSASFGSTGYVNVTGDYIRNPVLEVKLAAGTYTTTAGWGANVIEELLIKEPGEIDLRISGISNMVQSIREFDKNELRDEYVLLLGGAETNPGAEITAYIFLNILNSSVNPLLSQFYPNNQKGPTEIKLYIKFRPMDKVLASGTTTISSVKLYYEEGDYYNKALSKSSPSQDIQFTYGYIPYELFNIPLAATNTHKIQITNFEPSEYEELVFVVVPDTDIANNNNFYGVRLIDKEMTIDNQKVIDEPANYSKVKELLTNEKNIKFSLGGNDRHLNVFDLAPLPYLKQIKSGILYHGVALANRTITISFKTPGSVLSTCYVYALRKVGRVFKNGIVKRHYLGK